MKKICQMVFMAAIVSFSIAVYAKQDAQTSLDAVVEIRISVPENARTAERFGTKRVASGVVIDKNGHILTIGFQTIDAENVVIVGKDQKTVKAIVVAYDRNTGLGLLRAIRPLQVDPMPFGSSSEVEAGEPVLAVSYGSANAVQGVVVVARKEFAGSWEYLLENAIFTTPAIERFSGAALVNRDGHLVGIGYLFSQLTMEDLGAMNVNMFVPIDVLKPILSHLKLSGTANLPPRPWLGVRTREIHGHLVVERVVEGSPSAAADIKPGDIFLAVNKTEIQGMADFYRKVWALGKAGVDVPIRVLQGARIRDLIVHSTTRTQALRPGREETPTGTEL